MIFLISSVVLLPVIPPPLVDLTFFKHTFFTVASHEKNSHMTQAAAAFNIFDAFIPTYHNLSFPLDHTLSAPPRDKKIQKKY